VRPYYEIDGEGGIVSQVHVSVGPMQTWLSAAGFMTPDREERGVELTFDDFWVGVPRPDGETFVKRVGRLLFVKGPARFPVDVADMEEGMVAFRFTAFDSVIVARRLPAGEGITALNDSYLV